ncbi:hypothetical protein [Nostoc punctiforme]|nr:hypothetical protein [Nostoc punctiforme]
MISIQLDKRRSLSFADSSGRLCYVCKQRCGLGQRSQKDLA